MDDVFEKGEVEQFEEEGEEEDKVEDVREEGYEFDKIEVEDYVMVVVDKVVEVGVIEEQYGYLGMLVK